MSNRTFHETFRAISQFHENDKLIARVQSWRWVVWFTPKRRRLILSLGAIFAGVVGLLNRHADWDNYLVATTWLGPSFAIPILFGLVYMLYLSAKNFDRLPAVVRRRPQVSLHLVFWALLAVIWLSPDQEGLWKTVLKLIVLSLPYLIWRCGYMVMSGQRGKASSTQFFDHLFYLWPVWDGTNTPPGKGFDYLSQHESQSTEAYARSLLAGIKLLFLAMIWGMAYQLMGTVVYGDPKNSLTGMLGGYSLGIPQLKHIVSGNVAFSLLSAWISLYCDLIWRTLKIAARGHHWIGVLRLFGFNVFRNTYKPLLAESIISFWNRYYYYFKELLVEFFFYPTYLRYFRTRPKLRIFAAVFAAAFMGNMYYHLLQGKNALVAGEIMKMWHKLSPRMVYCTLLVIGIYISMLRQQKMRGKPEKANPTATRFYRLRKIAGVWTFYSLINFWNLRSRLTVFERGKLFLSLFGFKF